MRASGIWSAAGSFGQVDSQFGTENRGQSDESSGLAVADYSVKPIMIGDRQTGKPQPNGL
jgi:hypothetical protein